MATETERSERLTEREACLPGHNRRATFLAVNGVGPWICWCVNEKLDRSTHRHCTPYKTYGSPGAECLRYFVGWLMTSRMILCRVIQSTHSLLLTPNNLSGI